ncbi:MAG: tyrosine-type recombinase/integrase, partial [Lachnospiraceae bacterium]|nr:tyrosine-type recombinase/integrase [Lachnospiraceae bacterium]
ALKESDLRNGYLHIRREEIIDAKLLSNGEFGPRTYTVVEHCKTDAGLRDIPAIKEVNEIIKTVLEANKARSIDSEYLFVKRDGSKMHARSVDKKIRTLCSRTGLTPRSAHKLRKTFISTLLDANMNLDTVRRIAGHRDEKVTLSNYYYDRSTPDAIRMQLENALK